MPSFLVAVDGKAAKQMKDTAGNGSAEAVDVLPLVFPAGKNRVLVPQVLAVGRVR